jgi:hypothetical protein
MIRKKPAPDLIRRAHRFSEKIMLHQKASRDPIGAKPLVQGDEHGGLKCAGLYASLRP